ncbi:MAG: response regulator transcription factor [Oscillospiraceae bacterium]|nr:response regulator transcription factor [Oscillospiraceae bacterium]
MIKIVIADDDSIVRNGLKTIIEQDKDIKVCGVAENGIVAYDLCRSMSPDLVLMDMQMPACDGSDATKRIKTDFPKIKVLVLTTFDDKETVSKALSSGADGYVLKGVDEDKLSNAIKSTVMGINVFGTAVFNSIKNKYVSRTDKNQAKLTPREKELLTLVAQGLSNKEIAGKMFLSDGTVRNNISSLLEKLNMKDRTQLAVYAVKNDYI